MSAAGIRIGRPPLDEKRERAIIALHGTGTPKKQVAFRTKVSEATVRRVFAEHEARLAGVEPPPRRQAQKPAYEVPAWVRAEHVSIFHKVAQREGEEEAASVCRRLKAAEARL